MNVFRHQLPRLSPQKELAERQISSHQKHDGQAHPPLLNSSFFHSSGDGVVMFGEVLSYCTTWPRTLNQQHLGEGVDWELMRQTCPESHVTFDLLNVFCEMCFEPMNWMTVSGALIAVQLGLMNLNWVEISSRDGDLFLYSSCVANYEACSGEY